MTLVAEQAPGSEIRTRDAILDASLRLFVTNGYFQTTIDAIAEAAGIAKGTVYVHFRSKRDLALELYALCAQRITLGLEGLLEDRASTEERLRQLIGHVFDWAQTHPEEATYFLVVRHSEIFGLPNEGTVRESPGKMFHQIIQDGIDSGELDVRNLRLASSVAGIPLSLVRQKLEGWYEGDLKDDVDDVARMCVMALGMSPVRDGA